MSSTPALLPVIEKALAGLLRHDPLTMDKIVGMSGKVLAVEFTGLEKSLYLLPLNDGVSLLTEYSGEADVRLQGSPSAFLKLAIDRKQGKSTLTGDVSITGDLVLGQQLQSIFSELDIDWEEILAGYTGDIVAHKLGNAARGFGRWMRETRATLAQDVSEFVRIETEMIAERSQVHDLVDAVDDLRMDADRLEKLFQRLENRNR